jgi:hypothetical protein
MSRLHACTAALAGTVASGVARAAISVAAGALSGRTGRKPVPAAGPRATP